jgi:hypothetical protein
MMASSTHDIADEPMMCGRSSLARFCSGQNRDLTDLGSRPATQLQREERPPRDFAPVESNAALPLPDGPITVGIEGG